jgi:transcriptional regulator with XRE-family HTH domain
MHAPSVTIRQPTDCLRKLSLVNGKLLLYVRNSCATTAHSASTHMKIGEQIRARREQLGVSVNELANRAGVSAQAVRYWESSRSFPGKSKAPGVEAALSFTLDWTEGKRVNPAQPQMASLVNREDVELLLVLGRLPEPFKKLIGDLARMHLAAVAGGKQNFSSRNKEKARPEFKETKSGANVAKRLSAAAIKRPAVRKTAAR